MQSPTQELPVTSDHTGGDGQQTSRSAKVSTRLRLALIGILGLAVLASLAWLPVGDYLGRFLGWVESQGAWGPGFVVGAYVLACVLFVPGSLLTLGAGFLFGPVVGMVTVSIGRTLGATAAFLVGRYVARGWVEKRAKAHPKFHAIDRAVGRQGFKIVLLTRLSPVFPFNLLNYAFGLTKVRLGHYVLASWIGMIPGTLMYVYLGSAAKGLTVLATGTERPGIGQQAFFVFGLLMTVVVTVVVTRLARRALAEAIPSEQTDFPTDKGESHDQDR